MKTYHLSHIDLDGYGAQYLSELALGTENIVFFNSNYGLEIKNNLEEILKQIGEGNGKILITDLNLLPEIGEWLHNEIIASNGRIELQLLDHHKTGAAVAAKYSWYHLDETKCATKLTYEYFRTLNLISEFDQHTETFSDMVNDLDMWYTENKFFKKGKLLSNCIFNLSYPFPREIREEKVKFIRFMLPKVFNLIYQGNSVSEIENHLLNNIKESFVKNDIPEEVYNDPETLIDDKYNYFTAEKIAKMEFPILNFNGINIKVFFGMDSGVFQNIANIMVIEGKGFEACLNILRTGKLSLRSRSDVDVSIVAKDFFNGGGHKNACGGFLTKEKKEWKQEEVMEFLTKMTTKE